MDHRVASLLLCLAQPYKHPSTQKTSKLSTLPGGISLISDIVILYDRDALHHSMQLKDMAPLKDGMHGLHE